MSAQSFTETTALQATVEALCKRNAELLEQNLLLNAQIHDYFPQIRKDMQEIQEKHRILVDEAVKMMIELNAKRQQVEVLKNAHRETQTKRIRYSMFVNKLIDKAKNSQDSEWVEFITSHLPAFHD